MLMYPNEEEKRNQKNGAERRGSRHIQKYGNEERKSKKSNCKQEC